MVQENALWPGWETVKLLGRGSFGAVYEIRRDLFGTTEAGAVKVISIPQNDSEIDDLRADGYDQESIENTYSQHMRSIVGEYAVMCKLNACPNIVDCKDVRYEQHPDGIGWDIFIKMELLTPLVKAFPGQISEQLVLKAGKDLCHALILCKQHNVLHRDIKPQNIFVSNAGDFKLGDFGIAKTVERTMGGTKIGTYKYMAPEVYNSQPYGSAADIYSLGLVLYWMLNDHRLPFLPMPPAMPTFSQEEDAKQRRFRGEPIPAPKNGSEALKAIVLKACAFNPSDRFHSAAEMLQALEQAERAPAPAPAAPVQTEAPSYAPQEATVRARPVPQVKPQPEPAPEPQQALPSPKTRSERFPVITTLLGIAFILLATIIHSLPLWGLGIVILFLGFLPRKTTWTDIAAISAGRFHTVGLKKNGTVIAVGLNGEGQCNVGGWTDIVSVSAGSRHTVGLKKNGTLVAVGTNSSGECNVKGWTDIVSVSVGNFHTVALKKNGTAVAAGWNNKGQCNVNQWTDIVAISAGWDHTVGLKKNGTAVAVGWNNEGQCNVNQWTDIVAICAGWDHTVGLKKNGTVVAVGNNGDGQCNVAQWTDIVAVSAGQNYTVGLKKNGTVVAVGSNDDGQCNVRGWTDIVAISAGNDHTVGLKKNNTVVAVGWNDDGQCNVSG